MKRNLLILKMLAVSVLLLMGLSAKAITDNTELITNGNFGTNVTASQNVSSITGIWFAGDNTLGTWNTEGGYKADAATGAFVTSTGSVPTNAYDNFLGQITSDATVNTGRYRFSINASGNQPFYIKISSSVAFGTELTYTLKNPSNAAIEKQGTADYPGYSLKITPTGTATTYSADLYLSNSTPSAVRIFLVFPKIGNVTVDDISFKRLGDIPTTYYVRPTGSSLWSNLLNAGAIISDQIIEGNALSIDGAYTYFIATGNYTTGGLNITSGKIYGGFSGNETSIDLDARPTSDIDGNGITEPWEFSNEASIKSGLANSNFTGSGVPSRLLVISGNGGEVNGVTLSDFNMITYGGPITLGKAATTPVPADTVSTLAGTLRYCTIKRIKSAVDGAIVMNNPYSLIDHCLIEGTVNLAGNSGGAVNMKLFGGKLEGCVIRNNISAHATAGRGGAVYVSTASTTGNAGTIRNCLIYNNASSAQGGAIRIDGQTGKRGVQIINCTIANNKTGFGGGSSQASVEFINCGLISNSIVVNQALTETGTEIRANNANSYICNTVYGDSTYTAGGVKSNTMKSKITPNLNFKSPTIFSGVSIEDYTTPWDATAIANYNAIRHANFTVSNTASPAVMVVGSTSLPSTYTYTGGSVSITTTVPANDITTLTRTPNYTLGAYQATLNVANGSPLTIGQNATLASVVVAAGGQLTLSSGKSLTTGSITLESNAANGTATFLDENADGALTVSGTSAVNQNLSSYRSWYMSSPVNAAQPTGMNRIKYYNESDNSWVTLYNSGTTPGQTAVPYSSNSFETGKGYLIVPDNDDTNIQFTGEGNGKLNNGVKEITLKKTTGAGKSGFNLIGNPYPSFLDWSVVYTANSSVLSDATMWYRTKVETVPATDPVTYEYKFWTVNGEGIGSVAAATKNIPPMQAFWVRTNTDNSKLTLNKNMRSHAPATNKSLKAPAADQTEMPLVRLQVSNGANTDEAVIYFSASASNDRDAFDAPKMSNDNVAIPEIYTTIGNEEFVINGMKNIPLNQEIGLGFVAGNATSFSIKAIEVNHLPSEVKLILKDNVTMAETDITDGVSTYDFSSLPVNGNRFSVIFRMVGAVTGIEQQDNVSFKAFSNQKNQICLEFNGLSYKGSVVSLYNAVGQKLIERQIGGSNAILDANLDAGVYVVKVNNISKKVIVK